jgi:hypothetical protein
MTEESKFKKILYNEVTACVAIVSITIGIITWVSNPYKEINKNLSLIQKDIAVIQQKTLTIESDIFTISNNHLKHIQDNQEDFTERMSALEVSVKDLKDYVK